MGVELCHHPCRWPVLELTWLSHPLRGNDQPVSMCPSHRTAKNRSVVRGRPGTSADPSSKMPGRDGAVSRAQPSRATGGQSPYLAWRLTSYPGRQVCALGLDVEAACPENVVVPDAVRSAQTVRVVDEVADRLRARGRGSRPPLAVAIAPPPLGCRDDLGHSALGNKVLNRVVSRFHRAPPIARAGCRGASWTAPGCLRCQKSRTGRRTPV